MFSDEEAEPEPSGEALAAIEREWPRIAAELDLLDAEISLIYAEDCGRPTELDWRRLRRAEQRVMRETAALANPHECPAGCTVACRPAV